MLRRFIKSIGTILLAILTIVAVTKAATTQAGLFYLCSGLVALIVLWITLPQPAVRPAAKLPQSGTERHPD